MVVESFFGRTNIIRMTTYMSKDRISSVMVTAHESTVVDQIVGSSPGKTIH
jgi:hypothetical protein